MSKGRQVWCDGEWLAMSEAKARKQKHKSWKEGRAMAKQLGQILNGGSRGEFVAGFVEGLRREHRHLQGVAVWALLEALGGLSGERTDPRNAGAIAACKEVAEVFKGKISNKHKKGA